MAGHFHVASRMSPVSTSITFRYVMKKVLTGAFVWEVGGGSSPPHSLPE